MVPTARLAIALWMCATASQAIGQADGCVYAVEPRSSAAPQTSRISLVGMTPSVGNEVRRDTILVVDVDFEVVDFQQKAFWLYAIFQTTAMQSIGPDSLIPRPLEAAAGRARLCIPLADIHENPLVKWPLKMYLTVYKAGRSGPETVAFTDPINLKSTDVPEGALERQAEAPPVEYYDSLTKVAEFFNSRLGRYKICIERFPDIQPQLTPVYRAWESRHREQIELVSRLQFDLFQVTANGHAGYAAFMQDGLRDATLEANRKMPAEKFRQQCKVALADFADSEDVSDLAISDELELIRKHNPPSAGNVPRENS
jgi:hypothetical protein